MLKNYKISLSIFIILSINFVLTNSIYAKSEESKINMFEIGRINYNPKYRNAKMVLEKQLQLNEFKQRKKGFGAKDANVERNELIRAKLDKKYLFCNNPFFLKLLLFFIFICLIEIGIRKKRCNRLICTETIIFKLSRKTEKAIIIFILFIAFVTFGFFEYNIFHGPESYTQIALAKDLIDNELIANPINYANRNYIGFDIFTSLSSFPFFLIFKGTHLSLLLTSLFHYTIILILLYCFTYRFFGFSAAIISGFLFVFSTPEFARYSLIGITANHFRCVLFIMSFLYVYYIIFYDEIKKTPIKNRKMYFLFFLLGLLGGFGIHCMPTISIIVLFCSFCMLPYLSRAIIRKCFILYIVSLLLGLSLRIFYMLNNNFLWINSEAKFHSLFSFTEIMNNILIFFPNFSRIFLFNLRRSFIENTVFNYIAPNIIYFLFVISLCVLFIELFKIIFVSLFGLAKNYSKQFFQCHEINRIKKEFFLLGYILFYLAILSFLPLAQVRSRYFFSLYPFIYVMIGSLVEKISKPDFLFNKIRNSLLMILIFCIIFAGFLNAKEKVDYDLKIFAKSPNIFLVKGYSMIGYLGSLQGFFINKNKQNIYLADVVLCYDKEVSSNFWSHLALGIYIGDKMEGDLSPNIASLIDYCIGAESKEFVYEGLAISYTNRLFNELYSSFRKGLVSTAIPKDFHHYFYTNFGFRIGKKYKNNFYKALCLINTLPKEYESYLYGGLILSLDEKNLLKLLKGNFNSMNRKYYPLFFRQLGRVTNREDPRIFHFIKEIPIEYCSFFLQGLGSDRFINYQNQPYSLRVKDTLRWIQIISKSLDRNNIKYLYESIGLEVGIRDVIFPNLVQEISKSFINKEYLSYFNKGYGRGLFIRFANAFEARESILKSNIDPILFVYCYDGVGEEAKLY